MSIRRAVFTIVLALVASSLVAVTWLVAPAPQAAAAPDPSTPLGKQGVAAATAQGLASAKKAKKRVEVPAANTETTTVYANPDGTMTRVISQVPIRVRNAKGELVKVDHSLARKGKRLVPAASPAAVSVSASGSDTLATLDPDGPGVVSMSFGDDLGQPTIDGDTATYPVVGDDSAEITATTTSTGFSVRVHLSEAPESVTTTPATDPEYRFPLALKGLTPRLVTGATPFGVAQHLEFLSADGTIVASSAPLVMWDSHVDADGLPTRQANVTAQLVTENGTPTLVMKPSAAWLADPATQYPVVVDPDVVIAYGDLNVASSLPNGQDPGSWYLPAGVQAADSAKYRSYVFFTVDRYVGKVITNATLNLYQWRSVSCSDRTTWVVPTKPKKTSDITWNAQPSDYNLDRWRGSSSDRVGNIYDCGTASQQVARDFVPFNVTKAMTGYATGAIDSDTKAANVTTVGNTQNMATFQLRASSETDTTNLKYYCSLNTSAANQSGPCATDLAHQPTLSVTYIPDLGASKSFALDKHSLDAKSQLSVNQDSGNTVVQSRDLSVKGIGQDLTLDRYYNSGYPTDTAATSSLGTSGWNFTFGSDVYLEQTAYDPYRFVYHSADGRTYGPFIRKSSDSSNSDFYKFENIKYGDVDGDLVGDGASPDALTLTMHDSQAKYKFQQIDPNSNSYYLVQVTNRNGNPITIGYVAGTHRISAISDSARPAGRLFTFAYNANGYVTSITDTNGPSTRTWTYGYTGGKLTSYTDPNGAVTAYGYTTYTFGPAGAQVTRTLLTSIVNPAQSDGDQPETRIEYTAGQATRVLYRTSASGNDANDFATFTFNYYSQYGGSCPARADRYTIRVDNKNAGQTTYCFTDRKSGSTSEGGGSAATDVIDNYGNRETTTFNPDGKAVSAIGPSNQGSGSGGGTKVSYGADGSGLTDQVDTITAPTNGSDSSKASSETYKYKIPDGDNVPGAKYLPTSKYDANGICTAFAYYKPGDGQATGQIKAAYLGADASGKDCSGNDTVDNNVASNAWYAAYNTNGTLASSWDSNAPSASGSPTPGDRTIYSYYATGDAGIATNGVDQLKAVAKPGGSCSAPRKLCTSYTYDGLGRVLTVTDGRGKKTTYTYDKIDRITQVLFDSATTCNLGAGTCIKYTYDDEGNLTKRQDPAGTTTITWNFLNQQQKQTTPDGSSTTNTWDASGNLLQYVQAVKVGSTTYTDTVAYTYDDANRVTIVTDNPGTANARVIKTDRDGDKRLVRTRFITPQVTNSFGYINSGAPATASAQPTTGGVDNQLFNIKYDYNDEDKNGNETTLLQNVQSITYFVAGGERTANATNRDYDYSLNRLTDVKNKGSDAKLWDYTYDGAGNIKQRKVLNQDLTYTSTYFGVDGTGNVCWSGTSAPASEASYHAQSCPATPTGAIAHGQDAAGNNTGTTANPIGYNALSQASTIFGESKGYLDSTNDLLTGSGTGSTSRTFIFGALGVTAAAGTTGPPTFYTRDTDGRILDSHGPNASNYYYYLMDGQKTVVELVNDAGAPQGAYSYNPFGGTTIKGTDGNDATGTTPLTTNPFRYRGGFQDTSGLYHFGARFYDTGTMRWTQTDPKQGKLSDPATLNSYGYSGNDPINQSDASGEDFSDLSTKEKIGFGIAIFGISVAALSGIGLAGIGALGGVVGASEIASGIGVGGVIAGGALAGAGSLYAIKSSYEDGSSYDDE